MLNLDRVSMLYILKCDVYFSTFTQSLDLRHNHSQKPRHWLKHCASKKDSHEIKVQDVNSMSVSGRHHRGKAR